MSSREPTTDSVALPPPRTRRWPGRLVLALVIVGLGLLGWRLFGGSKPEGGMKDPNARVVPVVVAPVARQDVQLTLDGLGTVVPLATVAVRARVDGRLDAVLFKEGQAVKKGEALAQIDPRPFKISLGQATSTLARDTAQARNARLNLDRFKGLLAQKLVPQQQVDDQQTLVDQAEAVMGIDRAQVENAQLQLEWSRVTAPIDGVTGIRQVDQGNLVRASDSTGLVVLTQLDPISVVFTLPQDVLPKVALAMAEGPPLVVEAFARDGTSSLATGTLTLVDNQINQTTATIRLKAQFDNPTHVLWPNAFVKAQLKLSKRKDVLVVPTVAVQRGPKGAFVYLIGADQTAAVKPIELDSTEGALTLLKGGVEVGDRVVLDGQGQLRPGAKVQTQDATGGREGTLRAKSGGDGGKGEGGGEHKHGPGRP